MPALRWSYSAEWDTVNAHVVLPVEQDWQVVVVNMDSMPHSFATSIPGWDAVALEAGDTTEVVVPGLAQGSYRMYLDSERGQVLGGTSIIQVGFDDLPHFHWNLGDWEQDRMNMVAEGGSIEEGTPYVPRQFSINERIYPNTLTDPFGHVDIAMGDTCYISIANQGTMDHVLHFHGFHVDILQSTHLPERVGWNKDTLPFPRSEVSVVRLVAFQSGAYPVHNHNLIAVTNAGLYPGGMITVLNITP